LARQYDNTVDRYLSCESFLAKLEMETGKLESAEKRLAQAELEARKNRFLHRIPEITAAQALLQLRTGHIPEPAGLPQPVQIRIFLASGKGEAAVELLESWTAQMGDQEDERLRGLVLRAVVMESIGNHEAALNALDDALCLAEGGGFLRIFIDEGPVMCSLVQEAHRRGTLTEYKERILSAFSKTNEGTTDDAASRSYRKGQDQLCDREREVLLHLAQGLTNKDIAEKLFISLHTVKVHVRNIFDKLGTQSRTAAAAKGRSLGLLP
jgi:LuxR family maltose regulon positive regulatory protein